VKRKLWVLNFVLAALAVYAGVQIRREWLAAKQREASTFKTGTKAPGRQVWNPLETPPPVMASGYAKIAQNTLFHKSRNPNVVIEVAPPPPPPPMPPLPVYHGQMNLGAGPMAILSVSKDSAHQAIRPGEPIGPFKLVEASPDELTFDWNGQIVKKSVDELSRVTDAPAPQAAAVDSRTAAAPAPAAPPPPQMKGPGDLNNDGSRMCTMSDGLDAGTVKEGFKKVVFQTPFGPGCRWEPNK
jgi:hypothetical protein